MRNNPFPALLNIKAVVGKKMFITLTTFCHWEMAINTGSGVRKLQNVFHYNLSGWQRGNEMEFSILVTSSWRIYQNWTLFQLDEVRLYQKLLICFQKNCYNP